MGAADRSSTLAQETSNQDSRKRLELALWLFLWVSSFAAARAVWRGRADFVSFAVVSLYLWAGWIATFVWFLVPRARASFQSTTARRQTVVAALAFTGIALILGRSHGDTCELARFPESLLTIGRWLDLTTPAFSRCRALPTAMVGSLLGWFIGYQFGVELERRARAAVRIATPPPTERAAPTTKGEAILASTKISTAQKISVASGEAPRVAAAKCWQCGALLPPAKEDVVGRCRACGSGYRIVRAGAMLVAAAEAQPNDNPSAAREWWLGLAQLLLRGRAGYLVVLLLVTLLLVYRSARDPLALVWLLFSLLTLTVVVAVLSRHRATRLRRGRRRALITGVAAIAGLVRLGLSLPYSRYQAGRELAAVISRYPGAYDLHDPRTGGDVPHTLHGVPSDAKLANEVVAWYGANHGRMLMVSTHDSPDRVISFYRDATHRRGLELVEDDSMGVVLRGNGRDVFVAAQEAGSGLGTRIFYYWTSRR